MNQQVILNVGVSGSGKTTWSLDQIKSNPNTLRINRDDLRRVLIGNLKGYYQRPDLNSIEKIVSELERVTLIQALVNKFNIIIDNTNLRSSYINPVIDIVESIASSRGLKIDIKFKIFDTIDKETLKVRLVARDHFTSEEELAYLDKQIKSFGNVVSYIKEYFKDQIL